MDFSLLAQDDAFDFSKYFQPIVDVFALVGREVEIKKKDKKNFGKVESAFLKDNTDVYDVMFQTEKSIKIKIEVDTWYIVHGKTELRDAIGTTLNGMYAIMYPWILYIWLKDASNSMTKILL